MSRWFEKSEEVKIIEAQRDAQMAVNEAASLDRKSEASFGSILLEIEKNADAWRDACFNRSHSDPGDGSVGEYGDGGEPGNYICTDTAGYE